MPGSARPSTAALVFAWAGAALFAFSLLFFLSSYVVRFAGVVAGGPLWKPIAVDVALFGVFALHHSLLARPRARAAVRAVVSPALERSVYTWTASLLFIGVCAWWQFVPGELYHLHGPAAWTAHGVLLAGLVVTLRSSARLDVMELAGVRQVLASAGGAGADAPRLQTGGLYRVVRHPVYLGWVLIVFGTPHMTGTRLAFALISTLYLALAVPFEERDLRRTFGGRYGDYCRHVRWRMLPGIY